MRNQHGFYAYHPDGDNWSGPLIGLDRTPYYPRMTTCH